MNEGDTALAPGQNGFISSERLVRLMANLCRHLSSKNLPGAKQ
jgi:hypothetical protein